MSLELELPPAPPRRRHGYVFAITDHAFGESCFKPTRHPLTPKDMPSWQVERTEVHNRGVTIVWRAEIVEESCDV